MLRLVTPPIVDVILVNCNYGAFVGASIDSLREQTYPWFECIIVDNGSADDSVEIVRRHIGDDPRFRLVVLERNFGHIGGALKVLRQSKNEFVLFLDADDVLFPTFLASHLQVHLGSRGVAITTSNAVEIDPSGDLLTGSMQCLAVRSESTTDGLEAMSQVPRLPMISDADFVLLDKNTFYVPRKIRGWLWSPGTSNMYRRSVLQLFALDDSPEPTFGGVDCSLNHACHAMTGTMVITTQLSGRRVHGSNSFSRLPVLANVRAGNVRAEADATVLRKKVLETAMSRVDDLQDAMGHNLFFGLFDHVPHRRGRELRAFLDEMAPTIARYYPRICAVYGRRRTLWEFGRRLPFRSMVRILLSDGSNAGNWSRLFRARPVI